MKHLKTIIILFLIVCITSLSFGQTQSNKVTNAKNFNSQLKIYDSKSGVYKTKLERKADNIRAREKFEFDRVKNPYTGTVPEDIRQKEVEFSSKIRFGDDSKRSISKMGKAKSGGRYSYWKNRGPFNVGGRTRALAIDYTNENVILAGGVTGGLWRSENGGQTWRKVTRSFQNPAITDIVQDPRPSHSFTWYYTSGAELFGSAGEYTGAGVYKSQDGGRTWELLRGTVVGNAGDIDDAFNITSSIAINPLNGDIYVASLSGIQRSQDGGNSFTEVFSNPRSKSEIVISSTGRIYVTIGTFQFLQIGTPPNPEQGGFFTSTDGDTWVDISPEGLEDDISRTVMDIDPSNENIVYFLYGADEDNHLFKYNALSASWIDLSRNLPSGLGRIGDLNFQFDYNMLVKVSPVNSNHIFIGGTNLYRSITGFTTPAGLESWIAGYTPSFNNFENYTNHHSDQHALLFFPSNPNKVLSGHDGGVSVTEDILANNPGNEPVRWESLNNGYLTTQPYHVAFDPEPNTDDLIAGFQDNGTWVTNSTVPNATWTKDNGGDGAYSAIADNGRTRYVSSQFADIVRLNFDEQGNRISSTRIDPNGASNPAFINPFILDPNNDNVMYLPLGRTIWRNSNLDQIPLSENAADVNWEELSNTEIPRGNRRFPDAISALDVSKYPIANRLYYGSNAGGIYRLDNANIGGQEVKDIFTGKGLPPGRVSDINVDPSDSDRVIVSFSNYGIPSIFFTDNGGDTWVDISGNLEENPDGTGNGPSVEGTAFLGGSQGLGSRFQRIFVATSTGLYYTNRLNGKNTVWQKENVVINNAIAREVVTRKDGFIAVATHGNGLFSARFPISANPLPESTLTLARTLDDLQPGFNSEPTEIDITGMFVQSDGLPIEIELINSNPKLVTATLNGNLLTFSYAPDSEGKANIGLIARSAGEQVSEGFEVLVVEPSIYGQTNPLVSASPSILNLSEDALFHSADDFTVPLGSSWKINRVRAFGSLSSLPSFVLTDATVVIYKDNAGVPGEEVYNSGQITRIPDPEDIDNLNLRLPQELMLESGNYWLSVYAVVPSIFTAFWQWSSQKEVIGNEYQIRITKSQFGFAPIDWTPVSIGLAPIVTEPVDRKFQIFGAIEKAKTRISSGEINTVIWPNPSSDLFTFDFSKLELGNKVALTIYNISGRRVHNVSDFGSNRNYVWDASKMPPGFYFVKVNGENSEKTFKIMKK